MKTIQNYEARQEEGILLNANENNIPMPAEIREAVNQRLASAVLNRYPDDTEEELLSAYGRIIGVSPSRLLAGNGSDQMLGHLIGTFLGKGKVLYTLDPDFSMYDYYASSYEASVSKCMVDLDGRFDIEQFIQEGQNADLVMFSNPNNPTGQVLTPEQIEQIVKGFQVPVVVDEAYIEFADQPSSISLLDQYDNLYITRTLSKAYGLAGIRVGFVISREENMRKLKSTFVPYALNALSMAAASAVLQFDDYIQEVIQLTVSERERMAQALAAMDWLQVLPSKTNFVYCHSAYKQEFLDILKQKNVAIRDYEGTDAFRISIGTPEENTIVLQAAASVKGARL